MIGRRGTFASRVAGLFVGRVTQFVVRFVTSFLLAGLLGPAGRGVYQLVVLLPQTLYALGQFGLGSTFSFFAGRRRSVRGLFQASVGLALALAVLLGALAIVAMPVLESTILRAAPRDLVLIGLASLPFQFLASFTGAVLVGRQRLRVYVAATVGQAVGMLALVIVLVGIAGLGVLGAVIANVIAAAGGAIALIAALGRSAVAVEDEPPVRLGELLGFGARVYPASVTGFFGYRADVFMIGWLLGDAGAVGIYAMAVSLAELTFFVPDSVSTVFFPRVAGTERESAARLAPMVSRMTVLVTIIVALLLVPAAFAAIPVLLPDFRASLVPFVVILPGVVALSVAKVLSSYVTGLGLPLPVTVAAVVSLVVNLLANLILIPPLGVIGASLASVISYSLNAGVLLWSASRLASASPLAFLLPGRAELARLVRGVRDFVARPG